MSEQGNALITDNNSDTIDNITDVLRYIYTVSGDNEVNPGAVHMLKMVSAAVISLKDDDKVK